MMRKILLPPVMLLLCVLGVAVMRVYGPELTGIDAGFQGEKWSYLGVVLILIGVILPFWGVMVFKKYETNLIPYKAPDKMVTSGPFKFTRNPMYAGMLMVVFGGALFSGTKLALIFPLVFFAVANWWYIPFEEKKMQQIFGKEFEGYKSKVRRWI